MACAVNGLRVILRGSVQIAYNSQTPPKQRLEQMLSAQDRFYFDQQDGCLMGLLRVEVAMWQPALLHCIKQFFRNWIEASAHHFAEQAVLQRNT